MNDSFFSILSLLSVISFAIVIIIGIISGDSVLYFLKKGFLVSLGISILWCIIGYLILDEDHPEDDEIDKKDDQKKDKK